MPVTSIYLGDPEARRGIFVATVPQQAGIAVAMRLDHVDLDGLGEEG